MASALLAASLVNVQPELSGSEKAAWKKIQRSVATLTVAPAKEGLVALIDKSGLFLGHKSVFEGKEYDGTFQGQNFHFVVVGSDEHSQLVLLKADDWPEDLGRTLPLPNKKMGAGQRLLAVIPSGPIRAEMVRVDRQALMPSRRLLPVSEVRFEATPEEVGGALLFTLDSDFVGALGATLPTGPENRGVAAGGAGVATISGSKMLQQKAFDTNYGPVGQTTAYALGADAFRRVVDGFKTPEHEVDYPSLGIWCKDPMAIQGALIDKVREGSSGAKAGLMVGDLIQEIGGVAIKDQMDYAKVLNRLEIGQKVKIRVLRNSMIQTFMVEVGGKSRSE